MFSILVSNHSDDWEAGGTMAMWADRFGEYSGEESKDISAKDSESLRQLDGTMALLMYESGRPNSDVVRIGRLQNVKRNGRDVTFRFKERGRVSRSDFREFERRLHFDDYEHGRHHWAVKDGSIPRALLERAAETPELYDVALSFAGEDRDYVSEVAAALAELDLNVFYDADEDIEVELWGKDLTEHFHSIYRDRARFCVMFISEHYAAKAWTRLERRSALERALKENIEYILPARFDKTEIPGLRSVISYIDLSRKTPEAFAKIVARKVSEAGV